MAGTHRITHGDRPWPAEPHWAGWHRPTLRRTRIRIELRPFRMA